MMQTEMLIGSRFVEGHRDGGDRSSTRRPARPSSTLPEASPDAGRRGRRRGREGLRDLVAHHAGRALRATSSSSPTASRRRPRTSPTLEALNCGKPTQRRAAATRSPAIVDCFRFFAGAVPRRCPARSAGEYLPGYTSMIRRDPIGVVASIAPWNYPLMMAAWKLAPGARRRQHRGPQAVRADAADRAEARQDRSPRSCPKASSTSSSAAATRVGNALINHPEGRHDLAHRRHRHRQEGAAAAAAKSVKRTHLELGGKAPVIVFDDADIDARGRGRARLRLLQCRPGLHRRLPHLCRRQGLRQARRRPLRRPSSTIAYDQADDAENEIGPLISAAPARPRRRLRRAGRAS